MPQPMGRDAVRGNAPGCGTLRADYAAGGGSMQVAIRMFLLVVTTAMMGCATTANLEKLDARVGSLESKLQMQGKQIEALQSQISGIDAKADRSVAQATAAAERAEEAARKADAIFRKSVSK